MNLLFTESRMEGLRLVSGERQTASEKNQRVDQGDQKDSVYRHRQA